MGIGQANRFQDVSETRCRVALVAAVADHPINRMHQQQEQTT